MSIKYLISGQAVEVYETVNGGHIVADLYEGYEGENSMDMEGEKRFTTDKLFDKPPVEKLDKQVVELHGQIAALRKKINTLHSEANEAEKNRLDVINKCAPFAALTQLSDYLEGKISHFVVDGDYGAPKIVDFQEGIQCDEYKREKKLKLLTLFGDSKGNLTWNLSQYYDGSGTKRTVWPCTSLAQAEAKAKEVLEDYAIATQENPRDYVINSASLFGAKLPNGYEKKFLENCILSNATSIAKEQVALDARKAQLQEQRNRLLSLEF